MMDDLIITMGVAAILEAIKNPQKKEKLARAMLKIRNSINVVYADDPRFFPQPEETEQRG